MRSFLTANATQARQTKQQFANANEQLSHELGKAVQELPPIYTRLLAGTMSIVVFGTIAWAQFSQVDEVATAPGQLIASTEVRPVTSLGNGTILKVKVKEGEHINKDQVLIEREKDLQQIDVTRLNQSAQLIQQDLQRLQAERRGEKTANSQLQDELLSSRLRDYEARQLAAVADANKQLALVNESKVRLERLQQNLGNANTVLAATKISYANAQNIRTKVKDNLAIAQQREQGLKALFTPGAIARLDYLQGKETLNRAGSDNIKANDDITNAQSKITEASDKVTSLQKDIAAQIQEIDQNQQAYEAAHAQAQRLASERQTEILTEINKRKQELTNTLGQLDQAKKREDLEVIKAPVSGTVYTIKATTGPVQAGEQLLSILPDGEQLMLEVKVLNRDIGFIHEGMKAKVKMTTFPFQEFGIVDGEVVEVSPNAIVDQKLGLVFPTRIKLSKNYINIHDKEVVFTPGMAANGEIVLRKKSILSFIVEPITRKFSEAFSVR